MYDRILIPTDGSDHALRAAEHGLWLADEFDALVEAVHVIDVTRIAGPFSAGGVSEEYLERLESERRDTVEAVDDIAPDPVPVQTNIARGHPAEGLVDRAEAFDADLIAMGTRGQTGLKRFLIGSVAEHVIREAPAPVLTAEATDEDEVGSYDDVLLPTDGSDTAERAIEHAIEVAATADAHLHTISVVEEETATLDSTRAKAGDSGDERDPGAAATAPVAERADEAGLNATRAVREGHAARSIRKYARGNDVDLVVLGTHGRTGLDRAVVGSTAEWLVRHAERPVVTVPPAESD